MASFQHFSSDSDDLRYRSGLLSIKECYSLGQGKSKNVCGVSTSVTHFERDQISESSTCNSTSDNNVSIKTPAISIPTFKGFPLYILPHIGVGKDEVSSLIPELDYLLIGFGIDKDSADPIEDEESATVKQYDKNTISSYQRFGYIKQPKSQMANKGYVMYMMFNQVMYEGGISSWNGPKDIIIRTESGRTSIDCKDMFSCIDEYSPVFYVSPAEESNSGSYGKNISFRSIYRANDLLLKLLEYHIKSNSINSTKGIRENRTKVLVNIQGAHFKDYRGAASLGVLDLCKGQGKGLENVHFVRETGIPELKYKTLEQSRTAKLYDDVILGVMIGGLGHKEDTLTRTECIREVIDHLPPEKLRFISLHIGSPIEILQAIYLGIDVVECPYVYKSSLRGIALTFDLDDFWINKEKIDYNLCEKENMEEFLLKGDFSSLDFLNNDRLKCFGGAKYIDLSDRKYSCDMGKITDNSPVRYSRSYVHHLINSKEILGLSLLFMHNYWQYQSLLSSIRNTIDNGCFREFATWFVYTQTDANIHPILLPEAKLTTYTYDGIDGLIQ
ncbi:hypothetical protein FG386_001862 [Cryptosporidium ryanae]|uniref:uncharacterized protein n=1 Tax=Cryptosporidium ryanae TaxID=515981 RepID=UPI00351A29A1|nr:hypothetical protein FG386_001862 [Cryptosporidium ryanae]